MLHCSVRARTDSGPGEDAPRPASGRRARRATAGDPDGASAVHGARSRNRTGLALVFAGLRALAHFDALAQKFCIPLVPQHGEDLGARMLAAFAQLCRAGDALLIGTDCPALTPQALCEAAHGLADHDASFVPVEDGGYVAVGLRRALPALFRDIEWGSGRVMAQTRDRLRAANFRWHECRASWDVDRPEDFERLRASGVLPQIAAIEVR